MIGMDYIFYGRIVFVPYNFIEFNVIKNLATFYGTHPFHWYFTAGFPAIMGSMIFFFLYGVYEAKDRRDIFYLIVGCMLVFSFQAHKEFR